MSLRRLSPLIALGAILLAGCTPNAVVLNPFSGLAAEEAKLYWTLFYMGIGVFVLVVTLLAIAVIGGRRRARQTGEVRQLQGNTRLEIIWTAIPILLVIFIFFLTVRTITAVAAPPPGSGDMVVKVIGHRWWWEFDYPSLGIKTADELHIPVGVNVHLELTSVDVIHSFWVPNLNGKTDVVPGVTNKTWIRADQPGTFTGHCTEYCGLQHANMGLDVVAQSQSDFDAWAANMQKPAPQPQTDLEKQGYKIVTAGICSTCHTVDGTSAQGQVGPNLTHLHSRAIFAGGVLPLNEANLLLWLQNSNNVKPGNLMSAVRLTDQQIEQVIAYLATLK